MLTISRSKQPKSELRPAECFYRRKYWVYARKSKARDNKISGRCELDVNLESFHNMHGPRIRDAPTPTSIALKLGLQQG